MWMLRGKVVVMVVVSSVSAAPGHGQGQQFFSNIGNGVGFGTTGDSSNNNNNLNSNNNYNNNNLAYTTHNLGYTTTTSTTNNKNIYNYNSGYNTNSLGSSMGSSGQQQPFISSGEQFPNTAGFYGFYAASPDQSHDTYAPASWYRTGAAAVGGTDSSPALSALALLGFLYFLNLIQDVLQNNNIGRKRRSLPLTGRDGKGIEEEEEGHYITSYLEEDPVKGENRTDGGKERKEEEETAGRSQSSEPRAFSFLEDFFIRLPQALGMRKRQMIDRTSEDRRPMGLGGFFTSRLKMISSIMSFLQDPSPSRIRRAAQDTESEESLFGKGESESLLIPSLRSFMPLLAEVFREYSPFNSWSPVQERAFSQEDSFGTPAFMEEERKMKKGDDEEEEDWVKEEERHGDQRERKRRHSPTSMNAWYSELGGRNKEVDGGVGGVAAKAISLLGGGDVAQQAVKKEAAPALMELSKGLTGAHPHCLQRVLCRLTSHASQLSLLPRVALQMLSSSMVDESEKAMKAGLRGENCSQTFSECDTDSKSGKT